MGKLLAVVTRFLLLCAVLLALPVVTVAQRQRLFPAYPKKCDYFQTKEGGSVMLTPKLPRGINLTSLAIFLLFGLPSTVAAQSVVVSVPGTANWIDTQVDVVAGDLLAITATGLWIEGGTTNGPDGIEKPWTDNFFNVADLGVCMYCAKTATPHWGALIGYIGSSPPAAGSYTSTAVFREATKVFYVGKNYKASAPASGRLWLNKNTDAYSNYTVDNGGQVQATIAVSPPETEVQYHQRAQAAAASIKEPEPLEQATNFCLRALFDHWQNVTVKQMLKTLVDEKLHTSVDIAWFAGMVVGKLLQSNQTESPPSKKKGLVRIFFEANDGRVGNTLFDVAEFTVKLAGLLPNEQMKLFGILGPPALRCTEAYFWLTGELGGELGQLLRETFLLPNASIAGAWTLERESPIRCFNFETCRTTPIPILVDSCNTDNTQCAISRTDGDWQSTHTITRSGDRWSADFEDIGIDCTDEQNVTHLNVARIGITFSVTTADAPGKVAKSVGGYYTVQADSNPPDCRGDVSAIWLLHGSR